MKRFIIFFMVATMVIFSSYSASTSWQNRDGDWFKWNVKDVPETTHYVLLFAASEHFDSPVWLNQGTYSHQLKVNGGEIGGKNGGTKQEVSNWWVDENTQFYVECLTSDAEVYKWMSAGYGPNGWYYQPYNSKPEIGDYVIARSDPFSAEYLASNNYIGSDFGAQYFDFSNSLHSVPEPTSGLMMVFGLSLLALRRKMDTANNCTCFKISETRLEKARPESLDVV